MLLMLSVLAVRYPKENPLANGGRSGRSTPGPRYTLEHAVSC